MPTPGARGAAPATRAACRWRRRRARHRPEPQRTESAGRTGEPAARAGAADPRNARTCTIRSALRESIAQGLREFEAQARARNIAPERVLAARYVLCTLIDEVAAGMPWGGAGQWGRHSLLAMFHNETGGGEKVFQLMAKLAQTPGANRDLLELIYAALCLGFEGRYRVADGGHAQLEAVRERLAQILKKERGDYPSALAQNWRGEAPRRRSAADVAAAVGHRGARRAGAGRRCILALSFRLSNQSDPVFATIQQPRLLPAAQQVKRSRRARRGSRRCSQSDIKAQLVAVRDEANRSVVIVRGDGLFAPASATLAARSRGVDEAHRRTRLPQVPGRCVVTGHTDNVPIRTARFPSNWHLSEERARSVRDMLVAEGVSADRIRAEGRADGEPMVANDSAANRALNRRVEITSDRRCGGSRRPQRGRQRSRDEEAVRLAVQPVAAARARRCSRWRS